MKDMVQMTPTEAKDVAAAVELIRKFQNKEQLKAASNAISEMWKLMDQHAAAKFRPGQKVSWTSSHFPFKEIAGIVKSVNQRSLSVEVPAAEGRPRQMWRVAPDFCKLVE